MPLCFSCPRPKRPRSRCVRLLLSVAADLLGVPQPWRRTGGRREGEAKGNRGQNSGLDASRYCANVAPSIAEARIAWQTKRLDELDAQVKQRLADLESRGVGAGMVAKRDAALKAASEISWRFTPRCSRRPPPLRSPRWTIKWRRRFWANSSRRGRRHPQRDGAERASKLAAFLSGAADAGKKS